MNENRPVWELAGISIYEYKTLPWRSRKGLSKMKLLKKYGFISGKKDRTKRDKEKEWMRFIQASAQKIALEEFEGPNIWPTNRHRRDPKWNNRRTIEK